MDPTTRADRLADAAIVFALELADRTCGHRGLFGRLDLATARYELAQLGEGSADVFEDARAQLVHGNHAVAVELLDSTALWAAFASDD